MTTLVFLTLFVMHPARAADASPPPEAAADEAAARSATIVMGATSALLGIGLIAFVTRRRWMPSRAVPAPARDGVTP